MLLIRAGDLEPGRLDEYTSRAPGYFGAVQIAVLVVAVKTLRILSFMALAPAGASKGQKSTVFSRQGSQPFVSSVHLKH